MSAASLSPVLVSVKEAADMLGITTWAAYLLCDSGDLCSGYIGRRRKVDVDSVREYAKRVVNGSAPNILRDRELEDV